MEIIQVQQLAVGYGVGSLPALYLAFHAGKKKGVKGLKLLFGAIVLTATWPIWAVGGVIGAVIGTAFAFAAAATLFITVVGCVLGFIWLTALLKVIEFLGWCEE